MTTCTSPYTAHWLRGVHLADSDGHVYATLGAPDARDIVTIDNAGISHVVENAFTGWESARDLPTAGYADPSPHAMRNPVLARNRVMEHLCGVNVLHPHGLDEERYGELRATVNAAISYYAAPSVNGFKTISTYWIEAIYDGLTTYFWLRTCDEQGRRFEGPVPGVSRSRIRGIMRA